MFDDEIQSFELGPIDPADPEPLYQQLRDRLRDKLMEGWPRDRPIPSERHLMQMTGLSRMTVRQAITELVHEGMLRRDHGRGTFVGDSRIMRALTGHSSFRDVVQQQGAVPQYPGGPPAAYPAPIPLRPRCYRSSPANPFSIWCGCA